jgi:hypothetical protein
LALLAAPVTAATVKPGSRCAKVGTVGTYRVSYANCERVGKKLQWVVAPTQGLITGSQSCGSPLNFYAISNSGKVTAQRELVAGSGELLLRAEDFKSPNPGLLLFSTYDCASKKEWLLQTPISGTGKPELLLAVSPGSYLLGAKLDPARDTAIALIADEQLRYTVQIRTGLSWTPIWTATPASLGNVYLTGIYALTGSEFVLYGYRNGRWVMIHVGSDLYTSAQMTGPGESMDLGESVLGQIRGITSAKGVWACSGPAKETIENSVASKNCLAISSSGATSPAFLFASSSADSYWLYYQESGLTSSIQRVKVYCDQKDLFSCGSIRAETPMRAAGIYGYGPIDASLYDINFAKMVRRQLPVLN